MSKDQAPAEQPAPVVHLDWLESGTPGGNPPQAQYTPQETRTPLDNFLQPKEQTNA